MPHLQTEPFIRKAFPNKSQYKFLTFSFTVVCLFSWSYNLLVLKV